jgi:hypothetical protein
MIEKTVTILDGEQIQKANDVRWWRQQPPEARIAALEEIRREYHLWRYGAEPGFQRVLRIVERK